MPRLFRIAAVSVAAAALGILLAPGEPVERSAPFAGDLSDPEAWLAAREAAVPGITPGTEARILWAEEAGATTPLAILNLHGFSATSEEIRPVPDEVAAALGANLVFARLRGHGRDGEALAEARAGDWIDDTAEALAVARAIGDRVLVLGTSTGATLAAIAATEPDMAEGIAGIVMISPNFRLRHPAARLLDWPLARVWAPWIAGPTRGFTPENADHARYWTSEYPTVAAIPLAALMRDARRRDHSDLRLPLLMIYAEDDQVISPTAAQHFAEGWGGAVTLRPLTLPETGVDPYHHVIAGDILSPAMTETVVREILDWAGAALR